jgi:hypothetical protein
LEFVQHGFFVILLAWNLLLMYFILYLILSGFVFMSDTQVNDTLRKVVSLCYEMLELADRGDKFRRDIECGVVFGSLRDAAYKIRQMTETELKRHGNKIKIIERA